MPRSRTMEILTNFDRAAAAAGAVVDAIPTDQYTATTPCDKWTVRDVINHVTSGNLRGIASLTGTEPPDRDADVSGDDPRGAFHRSVSDVRAALAEPGAMEKTVPTPLGDQPGVFIAHMRINELIVHSWDLAKATGQSTDIEPELAEGVLGMWRARLGDQPRAEGGPFGVEQEALPGATAADRLAAYLGRAQG
ncbi:TIGR03086 family metal-binding protein [Kibdelosporangium lantanae]